MDSGCERCGQSAVLITVGIGCQSMITDDPAEYYEWQREQEHMEMLVEQYHAEQLQKAEHEMSEIMGCLQRVPEYQDNLIENAQTEIEIADQYLNQIKQILAGANKSIIATIFQLRKSIKCSCRDSNPGRRDENP